MWPQSQCELGEEKEISVRQEKNSMLLVLAY
jgi:hypothetical protein